MNDCNLNNQIKYIVVATNSLAFKNLLNHIAIGDSKAINRQVNRGSVKIHGNKKKKK